MKEHSISVRDARACLEAVRTLAVGRLAVLPTDTLYGLHGLATTPGMAARIARLKGYAGGDRAFILLAPSLSCVGRFARLDAGEGSVLERYHGQAISFILKALPTTPQEWTSLGEDAEARVAFRLPDTPFLRELLGYLDAPLLSSSANLAGEPPLANAAEIVKLFGDNVGLVVSDPDLEARVAAEGALPSTLVDLTCRPPKVLREGRTPFVQSMGAP
jgi:L-threonylcarbamoyladenylate synthase